MKDLQMKGLTEKLGELLQRLPKSRRAELDLDEIAARIKEFQVALDSANIELRHLGNHPDKAELKQMLRDHRSTLKELKADYEQKRGGAVKDELLGDHEEDGAAGQETADSLMAHGFKTQAASAESLQRTLATIEMSKEVGTDAVLKLESNTKQVEGLYDQLEQIESSLQRSTKIIRRIARKVATDKYVWVMICLLFCAVLAIIVLTKVKPGSSSSSDDSASSSTGVPGSLR